MDKEQIKKRCEAATGGKWSYSVFDETPTPATLFVTDEHGVEEDIATFEVCGDPASDREMQANAEFLCNAKTDMSALLDALDEAETAKNKLLDTCLAAGFIGHGTQIVGDTRYRQLREAEAESERLRGALEALFNQFRNSGTLDNDQLDAMQQASEALRPKEQNETEETNP